VVRDGSLSGGERSGEIVSPILTYGDIEDLQSVVRAVRTAGARCDEVTVHGIPAAARAPTRPAWLSDRTADRLS
jgi:hypothetical protein